VRKIEDYKKHADECRMMAARASSEEHRQMLLHMVETWENLAKDRTEQIARQARMTMIDADPAEESPALAGNDRG
jgi:hypothetical protein